MCFGNQVEKTQTSSPPQWLQTAAVGNTNYAQNILDAGFTPFTGKQVADFSPQQQQSFGLGTGIANAAAPNIPTGATALHDYTTAGPSTVSADTISSRMSPYMNQYVSQALAPQLELQDQQFAAQNKGFDSAATGAGAFGDTGWGLGRTNLTTQQNIGRTGLIGNAYNAAFNTAIGAGAQDVATKLNADTTTANLREAQLGRELTGSNAIFGQGTGATNLTNTLGGQQTAQSQADLNARYNEFMRQQYQDPQFRLGLANSTMGASRAGAPITQTTSAPDNSGWGMLATAAGTIGGAMIGGPAGAAIGGSLGGAIGKGIGGGSSDMPTFPGPNGSGWAPNPNGGGYSPTYFAADGGKVPADKPTVVGERGPELVMPNGTVIPNEVLRAAMAKRDASRVAAAPELARAIGFAA